MSILPALQSKPDGHCALWADDQPAHHSRNSRGQEWCRRSPPPYSEPWQQTSRLLRLPSRKTLTPRARGTEKEHEETTNRRRSSQIHSRFSAPKVLLLQRLQRPNTISAPPSQLTRPRGSRFPASTARSRLTSMKTAVYRQTETLAIIIP